MDHFRSCCELQGINCEFLFRAVDFQNKNEVNFSDFKAFLNKIKIGLTSGLVNSILDIFNDNLTESLNYDSFL